MMKVLFNLFVSPEFKNETVILTASKSYTLKETVALVSLAAIFPSLILVMKNGLRCRIEEGLQNFGSQFIIRWPRERRRLLIHCWKNFLAELPSHLSTSSGKEPNLKLLMRS